MSIIVADSPLQAARRMVLATVKPGLQSIGHLHWPYSKRLLTEGHARAAAAVMENGDGLLTSIRGEPTNLLQFRSDFTHAAMWAPNHSHTPIVEAVSPRVRETGLYDFFLTKDRVVVIRSAESMGRYQRQEAAYNARQRIGRLYDFGLTIAEDDIGDRDGDGAADGDEDDYCAELFYMAHKRANPGMEFKARRVWGRLTVTPQDFYNAAPKYWTVVWDSAWLDQGLASA